MQNIKAYCGLFYSSHYLPIAHCSGEDILEAFCSLEKNINVFYAAIPALMRAEQNPAVFASEAAGLYALICLEGTKDRIIVGPVFSGKVTEEAIHGFMRKNAIGIENIEDIGAFLSGLPKYTYNQFVSLNFR